MHPFVRVVSSKYRQTKAGQARPEQAGRPTPSYCWIAWGACRLLKSMTADKPHAIASLLPLTSMPRSLDEAESQEQGKTGFQSRVESQE